MDWSCKVTVRQSLLKRTLRSRGMITFGALVTLLVLTHFTLNFLCWFTCEVVFKT